MTKTNWNQFNEELLDRFSAFIVNIVATIIMAKLTNLGEDFKVTLFSIILPACSKRYSTTRH